MTSDTAMATFKQKKALNTLLEKGGPVGRAMLEAGYSKMTSLVPKKLTDSAGFKELLAEKGLTPELIIESLVADIEAKPQRRVGELSLGADILGLKKKSDVNVGLQVNLGDDRREYS